MRSFVYHIQINVSDSKVSFPFYRNLLKYLDYRVLYEDKSTLGMGNYSTDIWLIQAESKYAKNKFHRKNIGLNHISFGVLSKTEVDTFVTEFLEPQNIVPLYSSPKEFPEYESGYYAVFFEDPDRIKLEVTYKPKFDERE